MKTKSNLRVPPGAYLAEVMEEEGLSLKKVSRICIMYESQITRILNGTEHITFEVAESLARIGVPIHIWLGLENDYRK